MKAIEKVNGVQTWKQTFDNDRYGNRTARYQIVGSNVLPINNLTLPSVDQSRNRYNLGQGYGYDSNGNIISDVDPATGQGRTFVFNGDNKQTEVKNSSNVTIGTYYYDGEGKRVKKVTDLETTVFVYDGLGKLVAEYSTATPPQNPTTHYTATDTLGSPRVITDGNGQVESRRDFMPFGEELFADGTYRTTAAKYSTTGFDAVRQRFTGYQRDAETSLDFAEARYYQNAHGRFTAVDPLLASGKSADPQTFNRYVYVMNNPLVLVDPTGLQAGASEDQVIRIKAIPPCGFWCKARENLAKLGRAIFGRDNPYQDEEIAAAERKPGGVLDMDKQVGKAVKNYANDLNTVTDAVVENEPTGIGNLTKATVNNSLGQASDEELFSAYGSAALNTAATLIPTARSGKLAANMVEAGASRPLGAAAHHIVAFADKRAGQARAILEKAGIGIDDAANGVFLPATKKAADVAGGKAHSTIHTNAYYEALTNRLKDAKNVKDELTRIATEIKNGTFPN